MHFSSSFFFLFLSAPGFCIAVDKAAHLQVFYSWCSRVLFISTPFAFLSSNSGMHTEFAVKDREQVFNIQTGSLLQACFLQVKSLSHTFLEGFSKVPHAFSKTALMSP